MAIDDDSTIFGYFLSRIILNEFHIHSVAVYPSYRKQGIALSLISAGLRIASDHHCTVAFLEVRESNAAARALYARCGFDEITIRKQYYSDGEDAVIMRRIFKSGEQNN